MSFLLMGRWAGAQLMSLSFLVEGCTSAFDVVFLSVLADLAKTTTERATAWWLADIFLIPNYLLEIDEKHWKTYGKHGIQMYTISADA